MIPDGTRDGRSARANASHTASESMSVTSADTRWRSVDRSMRRRPNHYSPAKKPEPKKKGFSLAELEDDREPDRQRPRRDPRGEGPRHRIPRGPDRGFAEHAAGVATHDAHSGQPPVAVHADLQLHDPLHALPDGEPGVREPPPDPSPERAGLVV